MTALTVRVEREPDVSDARRMVRRMTAALGFSRNDAEQVVLAVLELATNLLRYAQRGIIVMQPLADERGNGIQIESHDEGPGIPNVERAMQDGYSTGGGLGSGLPAVRRHMDEFTLASSPDGTHITARKWLRRP